MNYQLKYHHGDVALVREHARIRNRNYTARWKNDPIRRKRRLIVKAKRDYLTKVAVVNVLTNGEGTCRWCGQGDIDVLCVDHVNNNGIKHRKEHRITSDILFWLVRNGYPDGFQILCSSCNLKKEVLRRRDGTGFDPS